MTRIEPNRLDLSNCDKEPIHIPGSIQPHGLLLAFQAYDGAPVVVSSNFEHISGLARDQVERLRLADLVDDPDGALVGVFADTAHDGDLLGINPVLVTLGARDYEGVLHTSQGLVVLELEPVDDLDERFDIRRVQAHIQRTVHKLGHARELDDLWRMTVDAVLRLTGYDRVMIYRFAEDQHGEVVAESRSERLDNSYLGLHYPASDIPAQARRLYLRNTLRIIVDASYEPAALTPDHNPLTGAPLDLSGSTLRSVSPIHREYLGNMGVHGSMSLSLVVDGALWGLVACHHYHEAHFVPYSVRSACEMLARTMSWLIGSREREAESARVAAAEQRVARLMQRVGGHSDTLEALTSLPDVLLSVADAGGAAVMINGALETVGQTPSHDLIHELITWWTRELPAFHDADVAMRHDERSPWTVIATDALARTWPPAADLLETAAGLLAIGFPVEKGNAILWFRPAFARTVDWAGDPHADKIVFGPNGPRLSPRGSFSLWREEVHDRARPWRSCELNVARHFRHELASVMFRRAIEAEKTRMMFTSILGHDLRNPLGAMLSSVELLRRLPTDGNPDMARRVSERIKSSGDRMQRMVDQLLDVSRIQAGDGRLPMSPTTFDLRALVHEIVKETELARPGTPIVFRADGACSVHADRDRIAQVVANLLGNARHHGASDRPVQVSLSCDEDRVTLRVRNEGDPIAPPILERLFQPFKAVDPDAGHRGPGLGLGLYITHSIVTSHGGTIEATSSRQDGTSFTVHLPRSQAPST